MRFTPSAGYQGRSRAALMLCMLPLLFAAFAASAAEPSIERDFNQPPASAKPWVYWYFMDGHLTRDGMAADLSAMKNAGLGGAIFLEVNLGMARGTVDFMSSQWQSLVVGALKEADRLGIQVALAAGPGWCGTGGPWITPELSMQSLAMSGTNVIGPMEFHAALPRPQPREPYFGEASLTPELKEQWREFYRDEAVIAFPTEDGTSHISDLEEKALFRRDPFSSKSGVKPFLPAPALFPGLPASNCIRPGEIIDLSGKLSPTGQLVWNVPPGKWTIMRLGRTSTGQTTRPAPRPGLGFESDKFERAALDVHFNAFIGKILSQIGPHANHSGGLSMLHFDSWEMGSQNWSPHFLSEFKKRRGYDPLPYLPAFAGHIVESGEVTERFLWDVRRTAQELIVENHVGYLADLAHRNNLTLSIEPYDLNPAGDLTLGRVADVPQCEFWYHGFDTTYSVIEAASIAHTCGRPMVAAEAFTSQPGEDWKADPAALKLLGDWAFCAGVNRFDIHRFAAQPWTDRWPGMTMGKYGVHWDRTETWWNMAGAYHGYLSRCQCLLQRGVTVADICFLAAEGAPQVFRPPSSAMAGTPPDHPGYNFDGCAPETLLERAQVVNGKVSFPGGTAYRLLVLPEQQTMTPELLLKIKTLVRDGATVFGPPPIKSPSLKDYPECDGKVKELATELWGNCDGCTVFEHPFGKGRVLWRKTNVRPQEQYGDYSALTEILKRMNVPPDFQTNGPIRFTHRQDADSDIYFLSNREQKSVNADCLFRLTGKKPRLFDPITAEIRTLPQYQEHGGCTVVPLRFDPGQAFFVVFQSDTNPARSALTNFPSLTRVSTLEGPWEVSFDPKWGGPEKVTFPVLVDWSRRPEEGIKYYSGTATYRKAFDFTGKPSAAGYFIDLGVVKNLARVSLNGASLGVSWCPPFRVQATGHLQAGHNELEIEVASLWPNRLIGDLSLPVEKRFAWTTYNPFKKDSPLLPSGLLGPVTIQAIDSPTEASRQ